MRMLPFLYPGGTWVGNTYSGHVGFLNTRASDGTAAPECFYDARILSTYTGPISTRTLLNNINDNKKYLIFEFPIISSNYVFWPR